MHIQSRHSPVLTPRLSPPVLPMNSIATPIAPAASLNARQIVYRTRGQRQGPIVRLMSPSGLGELIKPFVFLDYIDVPRESAPKFGFHPHSGIATLTLLLKGGFSYEDSTGATGTMAEGGVEWMQAGGGVWHTGYGTGERINGFQLWVALPPELENAPPVSQYLDASDVRSSGPARVVLGEFNGVPGPIEAPSSMTYLDVRLEDGESWRYDTPSGHDVAWIAVYQGTVRSTERVDVGELAVFAEGSGAIEFRAEGKTSFVLGSAKKHPHELVLGYYSVHTHKAALQQGESGIRSVEDELRRTGKL